MKLYKYQVVGYEKQPTDEENRTGICIFGNYGVCWARNQEEIEAALNSLLTVQAANATKCTNYIEEVGLIGLLASGARLGWLEFIGVLKFWK